MYLTAVVPFGRSLAYPIPFLVSAVGKGLKSAKLALRPQLAARMRTEGAKVVASGPPSRSRRPRSDTRRPLAAKDALLAWRRKGSNRPLVATYGVPQKVRYRAAGQRPRRKPSGHRLRPFPATLTGALLRLLAGLS